MKPIINKTQSLFTFCIIVVLLSACSHTVNKAPIRERQQPPSKKIFQHVVAPGETLYSIAWRYGLDYKTLARVNRVDSGFVIHPGEVLDLRTHKRNPAISPPMAQRSSGNNAVGVEPAQPGNHLGKVSSSNAPINSAREKTPITRSAATEIANRHHANRDIVWQWPLAGAVIGKFSGAKGLNKGIDIQAKTGDKVAAAATGTVVYAGSGLRGYGKLLIIKHSDIFLSAYGHNSRLLVKEGDVVNLGQHIADAGASGTNTAKLHFEIRRDGKPVNPLNYLPEDKHDSKLGNND